MDLEPGALDSIRGGEMSQLYKPHNFIAGYTSILQVSFVESLPLATKNTVAIVVFLFVFAGMNDDDSTCL